ncbi:unnamed protein product [Owenia fusiformis]|uniref:Uncharacterized protein n=1 Tax=Owenia fusiformis TaxID=6347 RepID=A0A8J1XKD2_OWEFU|nr:unnamed protein product [Owenia fusiformis]
MEVIIRLLDLGYSVFISDVDVYYLADPMSYFDEGVDVVIQDGWEMLNPGFMFVNNTAESKQLFKRTWDKVLKTNWMIKEQVNVDEEIKTMSEQKTLKYKRLLASLFPCGKAYFKPRPIALEKPSGFVAVHNTHIKGLEEKIYRFKEHLFWINDRNGYFTSLDSRYIQYDNPNIGFDNKTLLTETIALRNAIAIANLTNRILILPKFFCFGTRCSLAICPKNMTGSCPLSAHFIPRAFEHTFKGQYRESTFLINPRVPYRVKRSISPSLLLNNFQNICFSVNHDLLLSVNNTSISSNQQNNEVYFEDFTALLEPYKKFRILKFSSLYYGFKGFKDLKKQQWLDSKCKTGLARRWR